VVNNSSNNKEINENDVIIEKLISELLK